MDSGEKYDFGAAEIAFRAGGISMNALAAQFGIPEATLRRHAKKNGWIKGASETKRELVAEVLAGGTLDEGVTNEMTNDEVRQRQLDEATQDVADMNRGLEVARKVMDKLLVMVDACSSTADVKRIIEANKAAVETIRKIRALDAEVPAPAADTTVTVQLDDGFAELRAAFRKRLAQDATGTPA